MIKALKRIEWDKGTERNGNGERRWGSFGGAESVGWWTDVGVKTEEDARVWG